MLYIIGICNNTRAIYCKWLNLSQQEENINRERENKFLRYEIVYG